MTHANLDAALVALKSSIPRSLAWRKEYEANATQAALVAALQAIVTECKTFAIDHDSYLPPNLLKEAQVALALAKKGGAQ
jgi:hypothetical protein